MLSCLDRILQGKYLVSSRPGIKFDTIVKRDFVAELESRITIDATSSRPKAPDTRCIETGSRNRHHRPKSDARFRRQFFVPMHDF